MDINTIKQDIADINKLDFKDCENIIDFNEMILVLKANNPKYENGAIWFLYYLMGYNYSYFSTKYKKDFFPNEIIMALNDMLPNISNRVLKCKIATCILIENCNDTIDKLNLANIIIENTICFINDLFISKSLELPYNLLFAVDLADKFNLNETFNLKNLIKESITKYLDSGESIKIDFLFIDFAKSIILQFRDFWILDELVAIKDKLNQIVESKINDLDSIGDIQQRQLDKMIICGIYDLIALIFEKYKVDIKEKQSLYQKIIDVNLKFAKNINGDYRIKAEALQYALYFANRLKNKQQKTSINKMIQENNNKILQNQQVRHIPLNQEQKNLLEQYKAIVNAVIERHNNLFTPFAICFDIFFKIDFKILEQESAFRNAFMGTIIFDHHGLIKNIDNKDGIFVEYSYLLQWFSILTYELKDKLLKKFYPNKQYFLSMTYNNNIIPKGYEEIIARMLYAGIHNDNMDFFIYASVSIEAILRYILEKNNCGVVKNNKKNEQLQEYETLENMIDTIQTNKLLDESVIIELKLLFCREGFNIRNEVAHSKFSQDYFDGYGWLVNYMWCFMMNFFIKYSNK